MIRCLLLVLLVAAPARADTLFSVGAGVVVEPFRYKGPGDVDPGEIELSTTAYGAAIPMRVTITQDQRESHALGVVLGATLNLTDTTLGKSGMSSYARLEALGRVAVLRTNAFSLQVSAGGALEQPLGRSDLGILSNDNVEPFTRTMGGMVAASLTKFGADRDYTFDLRAGMLFGEHLRAIPVLLTASIEWGRNR